MTVPAHDGRRDMRVVIVQGQNKGFGPQLHLKILDGYRAGELVRDSVSDAPLAGGIDKEKLATWARETGYQVVN